MGFKLLLFNTVISKRTYFSIWQFIKDQEKKFMFVCVMDPK